MKNVTFDRTTVLQLDADGSDSALDASADCHVLRNNISLDLCAIADQEIRGADLAFDSAEDLRLTFTFDVTNDRHAKADARARSRFWHRWARSDLFNNRVLLLHHAPDDFGRNISTSVFRRRALQKGPKGCRVATSASGEPSG